jgi:probable rRNA maturation factor
MSGRARWTTREWLLALWERCHRDWRCVHSDRRSSTHVAVAPLPQGVIVTLSLAVQFASKAKHVPTRSQVRRWALAAHGVGTDAEVTIRYVDEKEGRALNLAYRHKDYATNVLTFVHEPELSPFALSQSKRSVVHAGASMGAVRTAKNYAADIVICAPVIWREAREQKKPVAAHHGHMVIHGLLHAQGFDHELAADAAAMEAIEIVLLKRFRIKNPYEID